MCIQHSIHFFSFITDGIAWKISTGVFLKLILHNSLRGKKSRLRRN